MVFPPNCDCSGHIKRSEYTSLKKNVTRQTHTPALAHGQRNDHLTDSQASTAISDHGVVDSSPLAAKVPEEAATRKRLPIKLDVSVRIVPKQSQYQELDVI